MSDSIQRTSIEFERQRHLANWFVKSSPHMTNSQSLNPSGGNISAGSSSNKAQKLNNGAKSGAITTANPLFLLIPSGKKSSPQPPHQLSGSLALFTSQTNLPLQIVTSPAQEVHKPKLRGFNSHDTSANMFSVAEFENARLARRNEIELKQRQQQHLKLSSVSSGGDCSTGDSKGSKYSNDSQPEPLPADVFLEKYSLPRIVRILNKLTFTQETLQSSSSVGSSSSSLCLINKTNCDSSKQNGDLFLLYRQLSQRKIYHGFNTKTGLGYRNKGVIIPQEFPGYFSLVNEKGTPTATVYTTLIQLVRERVYKFISVDSLSVFTETQSTNSADTFQTKAHYIKSTTRGGQVFRLLAVFEDGKQDKTKNYTSGREKEKGRYAQLLNENRQILYVSLTTKGKFYEIEPSIPQILQKTTKTSDLKKKVSSDCVHRINNFVTSESEFPINLRFISGPPTNSNAVPEYLTITKVSTENILIVCPVDDIETQSPRQLKKLHITPQMTIMKSFLGFENEQRMLANQNVQNILKFCQFNCDHFLKMIELESSNRSERLCNKSRVESLKILKPLNFPRLLKREKSAMAHEKEDSIIFLSKNDLDNLESKDHYSIQTNQNRISEKMKVFQSTKKKWFKRNTKHNSLTNLNIDAQTKRMNMERFLERYKDMSKLLQERFGEAFIDINERSTREIDCSAPQIHKSLSLQEVDFLVKPDLVPDNFKESSVDDSKNNMNYVVKEEEIDQYGASSSNHNQQPQQQHCQQSFISEKMYTKFHVKTRQYSKSSSSLHQLLNFTVPQRMDITETKKQNTKIENKKDKKKKHFVKNLEFNFNDISLEELNHISIPTSPITVIDDLPYSSVRDSLLTTECSNDDNFNAKENIYTEILINNERQATPDAGEDTTPAINLNLISGAAISRVQINTQSSITTPDETNDVCC